MTKKVTDTTEKETKKVVKAATPEKKLSAKAPPKKDADKKETEKAPVKKASSKKEEEKQTAKKPPKKTAEAVETKKASKKADDAKATKKAGKKADEKVASKDGKSEVLDDATRELFTQKIKEILSLLKKKKNVLEYSEISDFFAELSLNEDQMDNMLEVLENSGIDVLRVSDSEEDDIPDDDNMMFSEEDDVDMENIYLSVPYGIEDPVRMYLKEIGKVLQIRRFL